MSKKLYVGNFPFTTSEDDLKKIFAEYGELGEVIILKDKFSGRSKGFGFITIEDDAQAEKAIADLNGKDVGGRELKVNEAKPFDPDRPRTERRSFGGDRDGGRGGGFGGGRGGGRDGGRGGDRNGGGRGRY
jgi:RNA recognition motif-containing protein